MSKTNHAKKCSCSLQPYDFTRWVVRPLARRLILHHRVGIEQGKRILQQLRETNESIEIIAREIARWNQRGQ
jgi:hypothetical protein